jgi:superoxide dismutase, Cu-Zn family
MSLISVFNTDDVKGEVTGQEEKNGVRLRAIFTKLPSGKHGFHIHKGGDLRGEGCMGLCEHYHKGSHIHHGGPPSSLRSRHTGDLGNISKINHTYSYFLQGITCSDLYGRSIIVHEDEDDLGLGHFDDSKTTGHSGKRIACALIGRMLCSHESNKTKTRKNMKK